MRIFIDEAGSFARAPERHWSIACVGALVIPDWAYPDLEVVVPRLKKRWGIGDGEIKGRDLTEEQTRQLISLLSGYGVIFALRAIDMALEGAAFIDAHRVNQAEVELPRPDGQFFYAASAAICAFSSNSIGVA